MDHEININISLSNEKDFEKMSDEDLSKLLHRKLYYGQKNNTIDLDLLLAVDSRFRSLIESYRKLLIEMYTKNFQ